ncbi:MAG: hypothetical protein ABIS14_14195 [Sphingomonas sp.]
MRFPGLALIALAMIGAAPADLTVTRVDPLAVPDDDFVRHPDAATWAGLTVSRIAFSEERATWRLYRIEDRARPTGPLWFVPHDNENAGFEAALVAIHKYGGTIIAVDSGGVRMNASVSEGPPIDPNRDFHDGLPGYPSQVLAAVNRGAWPIIALHTNARGYEPANSTCPHPEDVPGEGEVSVHFCNAVMQPSESKTHAYPFDDTDTVAFATYNLVGGPDSAYCERELMAADFNVIHEKVIDSDGSLSNYAVLHHLAYLNFETQDQGLEPDKLAAARDRLTWMIDHALAMCALPSARPSNPSRLNFR